MRKLDDELKWGWYYEREYEIWTFWENWRNYNHNYVWRSNVMNCGVKFVIFINYGKFIEIVKLCTFRKHR